MPSKLRSTRVPFPLWKFLTQPVFTSAKVFLDPFQFQHRYHIQLLERCWLKELEINNRSN